MKKYLSGLYFFFALPGLAALNVPLAVQETLYSGAPGVARTDEPFCAGIPIPDSAGITNTDGLQLTGATAAQFRILGWWPSGNVKWVKVCGILPSLAAGSTAMVTLTDTGGASSVQGLAVDRGATITVDTGAAVFTVKKARFNVIDSVVVGSTTVVAPSTSESRGLVLTGPDPTATFPANVTCGTGAGQSPCTTVYSSANDPGSSCTIEENGPVMAVLRCVGNHVDGNGNAYMHFTAREYFYKNKTGVKVTTVLRNADYDTSAVPSPDCNASGGTCTGRTFNTAYKGLQSYELRIDPGITGTLHYTIATDSSPQLGTLSQTAGTDSVYIYQGQSKWMVPIQSNALCDVGSACANNHTPDKGFRVVKNGSSLVTGTTTQYPQGWADISDGSGVGMQIGMYQFAAQWPASLEFNGGGTDVRIGMISGRNSQPYYQEWPSWKIHDLFLNFHAGAPASMAGEFLKSQHYLVARAAYNHYNAAGVFVFPIVDPAAEDTFYLNLFQSANPLTAGSKTLRASDFCWGGGTSDCTPDRSPTDSTRVANSMTVGMYRTYEWQEGGPVNQEEYRLADLWKFIQRGQTGRYLNSAHFYKYVAEKGFPHSDGTSRADSTVNGFTWRSRPWYGQPLLVDELDGFSQPMIACGGDVPCSKIANSRNMGAKWIPKNVAHMHYHGIFDYYFMTGDETIRESFGPMKDFYLNQHTYAWREGTTVSGQDTGFSSRAIALPMTSATKLYEYLAAVRDSDADGVLALATHIFDYHVKPDSCTSGYPNGCVMPPLEGTPGNDPPGVSRVRGMHNANNNRFAAPWCASTTSHSYRITQPFMQGIVLESLLHLRRAKGSTWADYKLALDLAYGISQWMLTEGYSDDGQDRWFVGGGSGTTDTMYNGSRYWTLTDLPQACPAGSPVVAGITSQFGSTVYDLRTLPSSNQTVWLGYYVQWLVNGNVDWLRKASFNLTRITAFRSIWPPDFGSYQVGLLAHAVQQGGATVLQDVPFTVQDLGGGNYRLSWTVPADVQKYRIKWSPKIIAPSNALLGYDVFTNTFAMSPDTYATWFGANNTIEPAPGSPGTLQTFTVSTGAAGLTTRNFSVKGYVTSGTATPAAPTGSLALVSGNGQTGTAGKPLSAPFVVKVTDGGGNPVMGAPVIFAVSSGGGTLSVGVATTDDQGAASTILTLGPAAGSNVVSAASAGLSGSPVSFSATAVATPSTPANLVMVSGNNQTGTIGQPLAAAFTVKATDEGGNPVAGVAVSFAVAAGGGSLSAAEVVTDDKGLAFSTLTLGPATGTNTVTAASGALSGSPITFNATGSEAPAVSVNWTQQTRTNPWPKFVGYTTLWYEPVSQQTLMYVARADAINTIYATDVYAYSAVTNQFTHIGGTGSPSNACTADTPTMPGERHPVWQMAMDSKRNVLWLFGGLDQMCNYGTAPNTNPRRDMYYLQLNADPTQDTWRQVNPAHYPIANGKSVMGYDPDNDVIFLFGSDSGAQTHDNWVYCPTGENSPAGTLTARQTAAGCAAPDDWTEIRPAGGVQPKGVTYPGMVYDTATQKMILYGGTASGSVFINETWAYDVPTRTWTQKALGTTPPPPYTGIGAGQPAMAYNSVTQKVLYHQTSNTGSPADWEYDPVADTWTRLTSNGGPTSAVTDPAMTYDAANNRLITWGKTADGYADVWQGVLSSSGTSGTPANPCDLNGDGRVNDLDVQAASKQGVGTISCRSDLTRDGICNVLDVQRVSNAARGLTCRTGP